VNRALEASGSGKLSVRTPGQDLRAALQTPGMAIVWTRPTPVVSMEFGSLSIGGAEASDTPGTAAADTAAAMESAPVTITAKADIDREAMKAFLADAKPGDVVCFLERAKGVYSLADAARVEKSSDDRIIWLDGNNDLMNTSGMGPRSKPGTAYKVGHTGIYGGVDNAQEPTVAQSHIYTGNIANENLSEYLSKNQGLWEGIAVISHNFFAKPPEMLASRPVPTTLD
jgi:hypothetical protein